MDSLPSEIIQLASLPIVGALVGWGTNYLAIKMLFRPRKPRRIFGLTFHGVFPKRQAAFATKVGQVVSHELLSEEDIKHALQDSQTSEEIVTLIGDRIEVLITRTLPSLFPIISAFINAPLISKIKELVKDELRQSVGELTDRVAHRVSERIDIHGIVESKVAGFSSARLEELVLTIMNRELKFVEISGGVLGFLVGMSQAAVMLIWRY